MSKTLAFLVLLVPSLALPAAAAPVANLTAEYDQVRTIAQRDKKVVAAFEKANKLLAEKIVELDPALADYQPMSRPPIGPVEVARPIAQPHMTAPKAAPTPTPKPVVKPVVKPVAIAAPKPTVIAAPMPPTLASGEKTHILVRGENLSVVARRYGVSVSELKALNHIQDERKLAVGQVLKIPGGKAAF